MAGTPASDSYNEAGNTDSSRKTVALTGSWPTPTVGDAKASGSRDSSRSNANDGTTLTDAVVRAGWATPKATDSNGASAPESRGGSPMLNDMAGWATPTTRDHKDGGGSLENTPINALLGRQVSLAGWTTPKAADGERGGVHDRGMTSDRRNLQDQVTTAGWATPTVDDVWNRTNGYAQGGTGLSAQVSGETPGCSAPMGSTDESPNQCLNPGFSLWLMLGPWADAWLRCACPATA